MNKQQAIEIYEMLADEGFKGLYGDGNPTELNKIAYCLYKLGEALEYEGFVEWIRSGLYDETYYEAYQAIQYAVSKGMTELEDLATALRKVKETMNSDLSCNGCYGSGRLPENIDEGWPEEQCDVCYGDGSLRQDRENFDEEEINDIWHNHDVDFETETYANAFLLQLSSEELNTYRLKTMFKS